MSQPSRRSGGACAFPSCRCEWSKRDEHCPAFGGSTKGYNAPPLTVAEFETLPDEDKARRLVAVLRDLEPWTWRDELRHWWFEVREFARRVLRVK